MMRRLARSVSVTSLVVLILPSLLFLTGSMQLSRVKYYMLIATTVWFVTATIWMGRRDD